MGVLWSVGLSVKNISEFPFTIFFIFSGRNSKKGKFCIFKKIYQ